MERATMAVTSSFIAETRRISAASIGRRTREWSGSSIQPIPASRSPGLFMSAGLNLRTSAPSSARSASFHCSPSASHARASARRVRMKVRDGAWNHAGASRRISS
jgi:hypothetical protein